MTSTAIFRAVLLLLLYGALPHVHAQQSSQRPVAQAQSNVQIFGGKIVSQNAVRFVLKDYDNDVWYHIDDQQKASNFLGKYVLITGTFDGLTGAIRVRGIVRLLRARRFASDGDQQPGAAQDSVTGRGGFGRIVSRRCEGRHGHRARQSTRSDSGNG